MLEPLYKSVWRYASFPELARILNASFIAAVLHIVGITFVFGRMPMSYHPAGERVVTV